MWQFDLQLVRLKMLTDMTRYDIITRYDKMWQDMTLWQDMTTYLLNTVCRGVVL